MKRSKADKEGAGPKPLGPEMAKDFEMREAAERPLNPKDRKEFARQEQEFARGFKESPLGVATRGATALRAKVRRALEK